MFLYSRFVIHRCLLQLCIVKPLATLAPSERRAPACYCVYIHNYICNFIRGSVHLLLVYIAAKYHFAAMTCSHVSQLINGGPADLSQKLVQASLPHE